METKQIVDNERLSDVQHKQLRKLSRSEVFNAFGLSLSIIGDIVSDLEDLNNVEMLSLRKKHIEMMLKARVKNEI